MANRTFRDLPLAELRMTDDSGGFEGFASAFYKIDSYGTMMAPGCFSETLPAFLKRGFAAGINHDWDSPIGKPIEARETDAGLYVRAKFSDVAKAQEARALISDGVVQFLSIAFRSTVRTWLEEEKDVLAWWAESGYTPDEEDLALCKYGAVRIDKVHPLYEFCPVTVPANYGAEIVASRSGPPHDGMAYEEHLAAVLTELSDVRERTEGLSELRRSQGRALSPERAVLLKRMAGEAEAIRALLSAPTPGQADLRARAIALAAIAEAEALRA